MKTGIIIIVLGLIILLALPPFLQGQIKKKNNRKAATKLCQIFGYLFIACGIWKLIEWLLSE